MKQENLLIGKVDTLKPSKKTIDFILNYSSQLHYIIVDNDVIEVNMN